MDITYVGESDGGSFHLFHYLADGNRPVMEILIDAENCIWISKVNEGVPQITKGVVHRHVDEALENVLGTANATFICLGSIAAYVVPRIGTLMARVYCPKSSSSTMLLNAAEIEEIKKLETWMND